MNRISSTLLVFCCAMAFWSFRVDHEFYVSVGEMRLQPDGEHLEISLRLFSDDLELALEKAGFPGEDVVNDTSLALHGKIQGYMNRQFKIFQNGESLPLHLLGKEGDADAVWLYLESGLITPSAKLSVQHRVLMDIYRQQINILHFIQKGKRKSYYFNTENATQEFGILEVN